MRLHGVVCFGENREKVSLPNDASVSRSMFLLKAYRIDSTSCEPKSLTVNQFQNQYQWRLQCAPNSLTLNLAVNRSALW